MFQEFKKPSFRPAVNVGCLMDISSGHYEEGEHGEMILNGGLGALNGIVSRPNNFKTAIGVYMLSMVRRAMPGSHSMVYDTEGTLNPVARFSAVAKHFDEIAAIDFNDDPQFMFTDLSQYTGDEFFYQLRKSLDEKAKDPKKHLRTSPFVDKDKKHKVCLQPTTAFIDSFSKFIVSAVDEMYAKNKIGDGKNNTDAMTNGKAKNQLFNQLPQVAAKTGTHFILTAHVGDIIQMDMYPTDKRNLTGMKKDTVLKGVSSGFYSLPNNVWDVTSNKPLLNNDKMPVYPLDNATAMQGDSDLRILEVKNLRSKGGISELPFPIIVAQSEGVLPALTEFHYCKENGFGIGGNLQNYFVELRPNVALSRTKVRQKLNGDPLLRRAVEIQSEMLQLIQFQRKLDVPTPAALYEGLVKMGYDWEVLLGTRGYWMVKEEEHLCEKKFLSTMDLIRMLRFEYKPYWMSAEDKAKIKPLEVVNAT
ncbi:hypothetical protein D3C87_882120 [compost metagenome]